MKKNNVIDILNLTSLAAFIILREMELEKRNK